MFKLFLKNDKGEAYVGESVKIVVAIVLGAALLAGCVRIFNQAVLPHTESWIETMFGAAEETIDKTSDT
jgi:outer membrane murein-binding lipoprotein Lpp